MIHGWAQNAAVMRHASSKLCRKLNQAGFCTIFLEAPHRLPMTSLVEVDGQTVEIENGKRQNARAFFLYNEIDPSDATKALTGETTRYFGLQESMDLVEQEIYKISSNEGHIHLLGFSQGAAFCHILAALASQSKQPWARIRSAILIGGFPAKHCDYAFLERPIDLPSLHVNGLQDTSVGPEHSLMLTDRFIQPSILLHEKGHTIPKQSKICAAMIDFLIQNTPQE